MANYGDKGWIRLYREEFHNPLYSVEPFDKWHALMDLYMMADSEGTVKTSLEALKIRWFWKSTKKVRNLLGTVKDTDLGTVISIPNKGTLIRLNTGVFNDSKKPKKSKKDTVKDTVKEIEENTSKEVGMASLEVSQPTNKKKSLQDLQAELGDEYE